MIPTAPEQPVEPVQADPSQVWARPGTATLPAGIAPVPPGPATPVYFPPAAALTAVSPPPKRRVFVAVLIAVALLLAIAAVIMSTIKISEPAPTATTTTLTAPPPSYSPQEAAAAKKEACDAFKQTDGPLTDAAIAFVDVSDQPGSDRYRQMLSNVQTIAMLEVEYTRGHMPPATPKEVADALNDDINAITALVDGYTRGLSEAELKPMVDRVHGTGKQVDKVCGG